MPKASSPSAAWALLVILSATPLCGTTALAESLPTITAADLHQQVDAMRTLVAACSANSSACDTQKVAADANIGKPGKDGGYAQHWIWLRSAMDEAHKAKPDARVAAMKDATARLEELEQAADSPHPAPPSETSARSHANAILARPEFQEVKGTSWLDRVAARFWQAIGNLLHGAGQIGHSAPWLAPLMEWGFFLTAAAGLTFVMLRSVAQQRLQVKLGSGPAANAGIWDRESTDWARHAEERAAKGDWREALHALYWAAILHLESRRAWRHDPSRTPREYVRLLAPGSTQRDSLARLTRLFEHVWYGLETSSDAEFRDARSLYEHITTAAAEAPESAAFATGRSA